MNMIGLPLDRTDGLLKVTGEARYAAEFPAARLALPALTTVSQGVDAQARYLASAVLAALDGPTRPPAFPADVLDVVVRDST